MEALSPPPLSLSAPELSSRCVPPFRALRHSVSSTELLHEHAMQRFYKALAMREEHDQKNERANRNQQNNRPVRDGQQNHHIPYTNDATEREPPQEQADTREKPREPEPSKPPQILIKMDSVEEQEYGKRQPSHDSVTYEHRWQHSSFEDDYTASTVSTDEEYSDEMSLDGEVDRNHCINEEATYNPRDKMARRSPIKEVTENEDASEREVLKPLPLPNPNFIPKPILKKRQNSEMLQVPANDLPNPNGKQILNEKPKRDTIFKKITKMPKQKSFPFPKILSKKDPDKILEKNVTIEKDKVVKKSEPQKISDEGKTIIDYYGNIVKEYGAPKKLAAPLYLNTEDLKTIAEKQQSEQNMETTSDNKVNKVKKSATKVKAGVNKASEKTNNVNYVRKAGAKLKAGIALKPPETKHKTQVLHKDTNDQKNNLQQVVLKTTERATIVIPIDYEQLEKNAKMKVRSCIDYTVDVCLLALAFWVYLFKDERLAVPFLMLLVFRQLQQTASRLPAWLRDHTPTFLKKTS